MIKVAVSSYSFSKRINSGGMTQFDCIAKAKEMGFDGIEFVELAPHDGSSPEAYAETLRKEAERLNIPVTSYTFGADFLRGCGGDTQAEIKRVKQQIDRAVILGAPLVRHDATQGADPYQPFDNVLPVLADACRQVTEYAAEKGVRTTVENHGFFCQDSCRVEKLKAAVNHPNFGLLADMGNFLCADENPADAYGVVAPIAFYAHAKDFHVKPADSADPGTGYFRSRNGTFLRGAIIGHGNVPVKQCLRILKNTGYDGYVAIEFEGMEDCLTGLAIGLENLRNYIQEL